MPTHLDEAIKIILSADSKLRDKTPRIYQLPKEEHMPKAFTNLKRMRFLNHDVSAGRNIKRWLWRDYNPEIILQQPPFSSVCFDCLALCSALIASGKNTNAKKIASFG